MTTKNFRIKNGLDIGDVENVITLVGGVATFSGTLESAGSTQGNIRIGVTDDNEIDTSTGNLTIDSTGGTTTVDDNLTVTGAATFGDINVNNISANDSTGITINNTIQVTGSVFASTGVFDTLVPRDSTAISLDGLVLKDLGDPTEPFDSAHKQYVDDRVPTVINDLTNIDADEGNLLDGDILVHSFTDSSTTTGFTLASQSTAGIRVPSGTTAQRPVVFAGLIRHNSTLENYEVSVDGATFQEILVSAIIENTDVDSAVEEIDSFDATAYRSAKYIYQVSNSGAGEYQAGEIIVTHNGSAAVFSEYGKIITGNNDLITFSVGLSGGSVLLYGSAQTPNSAVKMKRILFTV